MDELLIFSLTLYIEHQVYIWNINPEICLHTLPDDQSDLLIELIPVLISPQIYYLFYGYLASQWRINHWDMSMGYRIIPSYYCMPLHLMKNNSLPHYPPSLVHILWRGEKCVIVQILCKIKQLILYVLLSIGLKLFFWLYVWIGTYLLFSEEGLFSR